jgi:crotonobetainyl-CoA:carnitine CoA-transferase CaiB-like acyl-CoA transferase
MATVIDFRKRAGKFTVTYQTQHHEVTVHVIANSDAEARAIVARYLGTADFVVKSSKPGWSDDESMYN